MKYLVIENEGITDPEAFTMLGVSTARGDEAKIGQFGSGAKHSILICLRAGLDLTITSGNVVIRPFLDDVIINNKLYQRVMFKIGDKIEPSSMTLDFGELDWSTELRMMVREFVSNALDASSQDWSKIRVFLTNNVETAEDKTRVFVEARQDLKNIYSQINNMFLHSSNLQDERVIPVKGKRPSRMYRKGVFVTEGLENALYDYNFGDELQLDEARNLREANLNSLASRCLFSMDEDKAKPIIRHILQVGFEGKEYFEHRMSYYQMNDRTVCDVIKEMYGKDVHVTDNEFVYARACEAGQNVRWFPSYMGQWFTSATYGLKRAEALFDKTIDSMQSKTLQDNPLVNKVIDFLAQQGFIHASCYPKVYMYEGITSGGTQTAGYTDGENIYLSREHWSNIVTILEEVIHLYTGAKDMTRDFQDNALRIAGKLMQEWL